MTDALTNALRIASRQTERNPSDAQKAAGNYVKGKLQWNGLTIAIENPKGGQRSGVDKGGKRWSVRLPAAYGYFLGTEAVDGDHVDTYIGEDHGSSKVFVIDQIDASTGKYDEAKVMLSYPSKSAALSDYEKAFSDGKAKDRIGSVTEMSVDAFKDWLRNGNTKKPLGDIRKGYATGGAVAMPKMMRNADGSVTFERESVTLSPADKALRGYADGGAPDWRSDMDAPAPDYDQRTGHARSDRKPEFLREPARGSDPTAPIGERMLDSILDYGPVPAKVAVDMVAAPGIAIGEAIDDPSLANITNAGVQSALALGPFAPLKAGKAALGAAGLGFGVAAGRDMSPLGEAQASDGLNAGQAKRLSDLQKKKSLSRAEREEQNALIAIQGRFQELQARKEFEAQARRDAALVAAETARREREGSAAAKKTEDERVEYNRAVSSADRALVEEKGKYTPFKETEVGKVYDKLGIAAPALGALGAGFLSRTAGRLGGKSGLMTETVMPAVTGAGTAGVMANYPLGHEIMFAPADNPDRRAYEAYSRELPPGHPRKQEWQDYARGLPQKNPAREAAAEEFYDLPKLLERTGLGVAEGLITGVGGAHLSKVMEKAPGAIARAPGAIGKDFYEGITEASKARNKMLKTRQSGDTLLDSAAGLRGADDALSLGTAEAQRRISAPGAASGLSEPVAPPRPSPSSEVVPSPALESPVASTVKRSAKKVNKQEAAPRKPQVDAKAIKNELRQLGSTTGRLDDPLSAWGTPPRGLDDVLDNPEVIMLTKDKLGRKQFRTPEGRYRGGPVNGRKSMMDSALDVARKFANGGVVTGAVVGETGGREDAKPVDVAAGSFVIPADVVSSLGGGNTLAGHAHLNKVFGEATTRAAGGAVPILISDGEHVITPEQVEKIGGGDMEKGHKILEAMILKLRKQHIDTLKSLPGPAKG